MKITLFFLCFLAPSLCLIAPTVIMGQTIGNGANSTSVSACNGSASVVGGSLSGLAIVGGVQAQYPMPYILLEAVTANRPVASSERIIFPNPSSGFFAFAAPPIDEPLRASLYDERGLLVMDATPFMMLAGDRLHFALQGLMNGSYVLALDGKSERRTYKVSIIR